MVATTNWCGLPTPPARSSLNAQRRPVNWMHWPGRYARFPITAAPGEADFEWLESGWHGASGQPQSLLPIAPCGAAQLEMIGSGTGPVSSADILVRWYCRLRRPLDAVIGRHRPSRNAALTIEEPEVPELKRLASAMNTTVGTSWRMFEEKLQDWNSVSDNW